VIAATAYVGAVLEAPPPKPTPTQRLARSPAGVALAAAMIGVGEVLEPSKREEPPIVVEYGGDGPEDDPIVLRLDPDDPRDSIVMIRVPRAPEGA
jgi:hypothetical protein